MGLPYEKLKRRWNQTHDLSDEANILILNVRFYVNIRSARLKCSYESGDKSIYKITVSLFRLNHRTHNELVFHILDPYLYLKKKENGD